jgi:hypothetical protein
VWDFAILAVYREERSIVSLFLISPPPSSFSLLDVLARMPGNLLRRHRSMPPSSNGRRSTNSLFQSVVTPTSPFLNRPSAAQRSTLTKPLTRHWLCYPPLLLARKDLRPTGRPSSARRSALFTEPRTMHFRGQTSGLASDGYIRMEDREIYTAEQTRALKRLDYRLFSPAATVGQFHIFNLHTHLA